MSTDGLGIHVDLAPPIPSDKPAHFNLGLGLPALRWPYTTRHQSLTYDSSPTPSSSSDSECSSSDSEFSMAARRASGSATHDVLLSYLSPEIGGEKGGNKVYLLSSGLKNPKQDWRRSKSETFKFPLPPNKVAPLKSALRSTAKTVSTSPVLRSVSGGVWRRGDRSWATLSPQLEEAEVEPRQGWSPYSSVAATPRQASGQPRFSFSSTAADSQLPTYAQAVPEYTADSSASSTSSRTLVSDTEDDSGAETDPTFSSDAAKLARLHASLLLLDRGVSELPLSLGEKKVEELGGSVEEKMAYLCGLGYRYRRTASNRHARKGSGDFASVHEQHAEVGEWWSDTEQLHDKWKEGQVKSYAPTVGRAARVVSNAASAVSSAQGSPILTGMFAGATAEQQEEGDVTIRPHILPPVAVDGSLGKEFAYLVDQRFTDDDGMQSDSKVYTAESGLMTPPLTTPELGLDGASPSFLDKWPSPLPCSRPTLPVSTSRTQAAEMDGCKPWSVSAVPSGAVNHVDGCKPFPATATMTSSTSCPLTISRFIQDEEAQISHATRTTISPCSVLTRPRPLRSSTSNSSLFSSAASDRLQKPDVTPSVLARPRPVARTVDSGSFANRSTLLPGKKVAKTRRLDFVLPESASTTTVVQQVKVPQRKSSLDVRAEARKHEQANEVHPNSVCRDVELEKRFHSSASPYLRPMPIECSSAGSAAKLRRRGDAQAEGMSKSVSLPVLFTARTPSQRTRGETGHRRGRRSVVTVGEPAEEGCKSEPPTEGVLVVSQQVTVVGLAF